MGDPAGVGPELTLQLLHNSQLFKHFQPVVFGNTKILQRVQQAIPGLNELKPPFMVQLNDAHPDWKNLLADAPYDEPILIDFCWQPAAEIQPGRIQAAAGQASYEYLLAAIDAALQGAIAGIVTNPINKEALAAAEIPYPGHTEILAERCEADPVVMMLTSRKITCSLVTTHIGYAEVPQELTTDKICTTISLTAEAMRKMRGHEPRLVVCGLNPHAGEQGLFGNREEEEVIAPAVEWARQQDLQITGPLPPDTAFVPRRREQTDAYICMYHDQGLIPLKAIAFDEGVNVTLGLPIIRTSVDHGTAFDIAWQGKADVSSLIAAIELALDLSR